MQSGDCPGLPIASTPSDAKGFNGLELARTGDIGTTGKYLQ